MPRIVLHIGAPKTGSTAIQAFCTQNRALLADHGIGYYPALYNYVSWRSHSNATFLLPGALKQLKGDIAKIPSEQEKRLAEEVLHFQEYCQQFDTVVLSEECLWDFNQVFHPDFWPSMRSFLSECLSEHDDIQIDLVVYIRRQDDWSLSKWKQDVYSPVPIRLDYLKSLQEKDYLGYLDYQAVLQCLEEVFGRNHLFPRVYERKQFVGKSIIRDFFDAAQLEWDDIYQESSQHLNVSASCMGMGALYGLLKLFGLGQRTPLLVKGSEVCNGLGLPLNKEPHALNAEQQKHHLEEAYGTPLSRQHRRMFDLVFAAVSKYSARHPEASGSHPLSTEQRRELMAYYEQGNSWVAQRYFGREQLFADIPNDFVQVPLDEASCRRYAARLTPSLVLNMGKVFINKVKRITQHS